MYEFYTDCTVSPPGLIQKMKDCASRVPAKVFFKNCDTEHITIWGDTMQGEFKVRPGDFKFYRSTYMEKPCYYFVHSGIEHVFIEE